MITISYSQVRKDCDEITVREIQHGVERHREKHNLITIHISLINNTFYYKKNLLIQHQNIFH